MTEQQKYIQGQEASVQKSIAHHEVQECRQEISRLLGLVGAPPLSWNTPKTTDIDLDGNTLGVTKDAIVMVVQFMEAHVQCLLAIDEAYQWLQISSSLHLGLGPRSQCVERVERASIARGFRNGRRFDGGTDLLANGVKKSLYEPQRGLSKSVLSLSNVRHHLAKTIVDQSDSILHVWHHLQEAIHSHTVSDFDPLEFPDVVDLLWLKGARNLIANDLSDSVNMYCTWNGLAQFSSNQELLTLMEASMWNARNFREYLISNLLLDKDRPTNILPNPNDPLLVSLIRYREQLDALSVATWSCQQYANSELQSNTHDRLQWWTHIQQLSDSCRAMEAEIGQRFFTTLVDEQKEKQEEEEAITQIESEMGATHDEYQLSYQQDDGWDSRTETKVDNEPQLPKMTQIFKGHGSKPEHSKNVSSTQGVVRGRAPSLPPRDTVSERQMIQELQNRIIAMRLPEDEDDDEDVETEKAKNARKSREPAASLFLGASGSLLSELRLALPSPSKVSEEQVLGE